MLPFCSYLPELCILPYICGWIHIEESENTRVKDGKIIRCLSCLTNTCLSCVSNTCNPADLKVYTTQNIGECWVQLN